MGSPRWLTPTFMRLVEKTWKISYSVSGQILMTKPFVRMISKVGGQKSTRLGSSSSSFQQTHCIVVCPVDRGSRSPVLDLDDDKSYCFPTLENGVSFSTALQKPHKSYVPWNDYYCLLAFCGTKGTIYWWTKVEIGFCPVADTSPNVDFQDTLQLIVSEKTTSTFDLKKRS